MLALENENAQLDHVKEINEELLAGSMYLASAGSTTPSTVPAAVAKHFKIGEEVSVWDTSANAWINTSGVTVSAVNTSTGVVTHGTTSAAVADGDGVAWLRHEQQHHDQQLRLDRVGRRAWLHRRVSQWNH